MAAASVAKNKREPGILPYNMGSKKKGILEEPQWNTYDLSFWGPNCMLTSFYLGAMQAMINMGNALGEEVSVYEKLFEKGKQYMETKLYNGEYFYQIIMVE